MTDQIATMTFFDPEGEDRRVVLVDGVAGYVACPDCCADERIDDDQLLRMAHGGETEIDCIRCKDTGKVWVSV